VVEEAPAEAGGVAGLMDDDLDVMAWPPGAASTSPGWYLVDRGRYVAYSHPHDFDRSPQVFFSAEFLADPAEGFEVIFPPTPSDARHGDEVNMLGGLVKSDTGRVWRLTGYVCDRHGYEGRWPD